MNAIDVVIGAVEYALSLDWPGTICMVDHGEVYAVGNDDRYVRLGFLGDVAEMTIGEFQYEYSAELEAQEQNEAEGWA